MSDVVGKIALGPPTYHSVDKRYPMRNLVITISPDGKALDGYVMEPNIDKAKEQAMIICGHPYVQAWPEDKQAEFEMFIREVLRTTKW